MAVVSMKQLLEAGVGRTDFTVLLPLEGREARENREAKNGKGA